MAFGAGALSFLSPCTLPLLPLYLSYITGQSVTEIKTNTSKGFRKVLIFHSIVFLLGVSTVYMSLGLGASYMGNVFTNLMTGSTSTLIQRIAGLLIIVMGLVTAGWLNIPALLKDNRRLRVRETSGYLSSFFIWDQSENAHRFGGHSGMSRLWEYRLLSRAKDFDLMHRDI